MVKFLTATGYSVPLVLLERCIVWVELGQWGAYITLLIPIVVVMTFLKLLSCFWKNKYLGLVWDRNRHVISPP